MTRDETFQFLKQAHQFFTNYHNAMSARLEGLHRGAVGDSRFVSAWLTQVAIDNAQHCSQNIDSFKNEAFPAWYHAWLPEKIYLFAEKPYPANDESLETFVAKTADYLLRAEELLSMQLRNSDKGYQYIPVPPHKVEADRMLSLHTQLQELKKQFDIFDGLKQQKSWLTDELIQASDFVFARVAMHGLAGAPYPGQSNKEELEQRVLTAAQDLKELAHQTQERPSIKLVKTTQNLTGSESTKAFGSSQDHLEHIPKEMNQVMTQFKLSTQQKTARNLKFDALSQELAAEFPTPKLK